MLSNGGGRLFGAWTTRSRRALGGAGNEEQVVRTSRGVDWNHMYLPCGLQIGPGCLLHTVDETVSESAKESHAYAPRSPQSMPRTVFPSISYTLSR